MRLILLGAPGAGKGTQADNICRRFSIPAISTGNIIREAVAGSTPMGLAAKSYLDEGKLVPDHVVIGIIRDRLAQSDCEKGFILDGFPRTVPQAEALEEMGVTIDRVIAFHVEDEAIIRRLSGRRVCSDCAATYHLEYNPSKLEGYCDRCGGELVIRKDDDPAVVTRRLAVYQEQTAPLLGYYSEKGILRTVVGQEKVEDTTALTMAALETETV